MIPIMVLILDGNLEIDPHAMSNLSNLICLRHLIRSSAVTNMKGFLRNDLFSFMRARQALSYHLIEEP